MKVALVLFLVGGSLLSASDGEQPMKVKVTTRRADDRVEMRIEKGRTVITVKSPFGISQALVNRTGDQWPEVLALRLHLKGLESFKAANGQFTLAAAVGIQDGKPRARVWRDNKEDEPLDRKNPLWIDIHAIGRTGEPAKELPLRDGYFELVLPRAFLTGNPKSITVNWIDFHR